MTNSPQISHPVPDAHFVPAAMVPAPVLVHPDDLAPAGGVDAPGTAVIPYIAEQNGTPYTEHPHRLIMCTTPRLRSLIFPNECESLVQQHKQGVMIHGVEDPFAGQECSWEETQFRNLARGNRVISLFVVADECIAIWTCFSAPRVASLRFAMLGSELAHEYSHGFPVEKRFENVEFPPGNEALQLVHRMQQEFHSRPDDQQ